MSILFSVIALAGDKGAAVQSARDDLIAAAVFAIKDGNTRNLTDTAERMRKNGAVTKAGTFAKGRKGEMLAALLAAHDMAVSARGAYLAAFPGHKGKASAVMIEFATTRACAIGDIFEQTAAEIIAPKKKAAPASKEGTATAPEAVQEGEGTAPAPESAPDEFAAFMADAVKALGKDKIRALLAGAIVAQAEEEAAAAQAEAEEASKKAPRRRKAA